MYKNLELRKIIYIFALWLRDTTKGLLSFSTIGEYTPSRTYMNIIKIIYYIIFYLFYLLLSKIIYTFVEI